MPAKRKPSQSRPPKAAKVPSVKSPPVGDKLRWLTRTEDPAPEPEFEAMTDAERESVARAEYARLAGERVSKFKRVLRQFKPGKEQRGKIVFVAVDKGGKPLLVPRTSRRKAYAVYVDPKGKVKPHLEPGKDWLESERRKEITRLKRAHGKRYKLKPEDEARIRLRAIKREAFAASPDYIIPKYHNLLQSDFPQAAKEEIYAKKIPAGRRIFDEENDVYIPIKTKITTGKAQGLDWNKQITPKVIREFESVFSKLGAVDKDLIVNMDVTIMDADGDLSTVHVAQKFQSIYKQTLTREAFEHYVNQQLYADFAQQLLMEDLVSAGSAASVERYSFNEGLSPEEWARNERGELWQKAHCGIVTIESVELWIEQIVDGRKYMAMKWNH